MAGKHADRDAWLNVPKNKNVYRSCLLAFMAVIHFGKQSTFVPSRTRQHGRTKRVFRWNGEPLLHISLIAAHVYSRAVLREAGEGKAVDSGRCVRGRKGLDKM